MLSWDNLSISLLNTNKQSSAKYFKALLATNGHVKKGEMMAILGESGSGKTTFLNTLSGVVPDGAKTAGQVLYEGKERNLESWKEQCRLIEQIDNFGNDLSVFDTLYYTGRFLNMTGDISAKINILLKELRLTHVKTQATKNLSGGEKKRVAIAKAIISDAPVVILDEPTSGLDTKNSLNLIKFLKRQAKEKKKIIILSLHQPGNQVLNLFDKIMLISCGRVVYCDYLNACLPTLEAHGFDINPMNSIHENISEAIDYDEITSQVQKIEQMSREVEKRNQNVGKETIMNKKTPLFIRLSLNLKHIYYLVMRRLQLTALTPTFYIPTILITLAFWGIISLIIIPGVKTDNFSIDDFSTDDLSTDENNIYAIFGFSYIAMHALTTLFTYEIIIPVVLETKEVISEIRNFYYTPTSYFISVFIFYLLKIILYNTGIAIVFYSYFHEILDLKFYPLMVLAPAIYILFTLFLTFVLPSKNLIYLTLVAFTLMKFIDILVNGQIFYIDKHVKFVLKILGNIDQRAQVSNLFHILKWSSKKVEKNISYFADCNLSLICTCSAFSILSKLIIAGFFFMAASVLVISIRSKPNIRLRLGTK
ncbi:ABC transporter G family member 4 [Dictyocoela roeselum]|nr:ABC transporter G family member 4 [Dictyocoela roeselum]